MACVKDLLGQDSLREAKLVAGRNGLYRTISWPNVVQTPDIRPWLVGGDVIIVTGIGIGGELETLRSLLDQAVEYNSACLIIYLSDDYIPNLFPELLAEADEKKFPIFTIPWDTLIANIIRDISQLLLMERYQNESRHLILEELLFRSDALPSESLLAFIKQQHLIRNHTVVMVEWLDNQIPEVALRRGIISRQQSINMLTQKLREQFPQIFCLDHQQYTYFLVCVEKDGLPVLNSLCTDLCQSIRSRHPSIDLHIGIGQLYDSPLQFHLSAAEARKALGFCCAGRRVTHYDNLGIYQLLMEVPDQSRVRDFAVSRLAPLLDYDLKYGKDFLHILEVYLHCNCNMNQTAQKLYVHRNTLSYQIARIQALLDANLEDAETRNSLFNCLKIFRYCQK